jgi:hypothetical protein
MTSRIPRINFRRFYDRFNQSVTPLDCGKMCAPHNPSGKPFCCDICHAVPVAYQQEWAYLKDSSDLWHAYRGDECGGDPANLEALRAETPPGMHLLACQGPALCQRPFRAVSCRQFPFFPYLTADYRFIGLAYEWTFEAVCWVISSLGQVTPAYREEFVRTYDELFSLWPDEMESYAAHSEEMREYFAARKRRIPLLHRNGGDYLLSPRSERLARVSSDQFAKHGPYKQDLPPMGTNGHE